VLALAGVVVAFASSGTGASSGTDCRIVPPTTVSPTKSRLWTARYHGKWVASLEFVNPDGSMWLKAPWFAAGPRGYPARGPRGVL